MTENKYRKIFILAAGNANRWHGVVKQLQLVNGESVLSRTIRQLGDETVVILTHREEIKELFPSRCSQPSDRATLLSTLLSSREQWVDDNVFILGDVVFTDQTIETILAPTSKSLQFYGNLEENFAIRFGSDHAPQVEAACRYIISKGIGGTSWQLYRLLAGLPLDKELYERWGRTLILDKTDDIDYPSDYEKKCESGYYEGM